MMRYAVFVALIALSLQTSARHIKPSEGYARRSIKDNDIDISDDFKVKAPWHGHADKGYPEFDGNPFKQSSVILNAMLSKYFADAVKNEKDVPAIFKTILKGGQKIEWKNYNEFLDYWGAAENVLMEMIEKKALEEVSDDDSNDNSDVENDFGHYQAVGV